MRADALGARTRDIRYVACDFEGLAFERALCDAGFDPSRPSCMIWEGVTMYLREAAFARSLAALSALCAPGSTLIATYLTANARSGASVAWPALHALLSSIAEPVRFSSNPDDMVRRLKAQGFRVLMDVQPCALSVSFGVDRPRLPISNPLEGERVICAAREADGVHA